MECAKHNITVNAIVPNAITRMISTIPGMASLVEAAEKGEPLPATVRKQMGMGMPEDVAPLLVFLSSDEAAGVTGQCIGLGGDKLSLWSHPKEISVAYPRRRLDRGCHRRGLVDVGRRRPETTASRSSAGRAELS